MFEPATILNVISVYTDLVGALITFRIVSGSNTPGSTGNQQANQELFIHLACSAGTEQILLKYLTINVFPFRLNSRFDYAIEEQYLYEYFSSIQQLGLYSVSLSVFKARGSNARGAATGETPSSEAARGCRPGAR